MSPRRLGISICRLWLGLAGIELGLAAFLPEGILQRDELPWTARLGLLAWTLLLTALWLALSQLPALLVAWAAGRSGTRGRSLGRAAAFLHWLAAVLLVSFLAWSWAAYWAIGHFLGPVGLRFLADNGLQIVRHALAMRPVGFVALNLLLLVFAVIYGRIALRHAATDPSPEDPRRKLWAAPERLTVSLLTIFAICAAVLPGLAVGATSPQPGATAPEIITAEAIAVARGRLTGPSAFLWSDLRAGHPADPGDEVARSREVERRAILPLDDWLGRVDRQKLRKLDVLLVLVESLRPDELTTFGGRREVMPNLDALAAESRLYPRTWAQSSHSNYSDLCTLTGQYPLRDRTMYLYDADSPWPRTMVYDLLSALGWRTAIFSSQNEHWGRMAQWLETDGLDRFFHSETFDGPTYRPRGDGFFRFATDRELAGKVDDRYTVQAAIDWIRQDSEQPFFIYLNLQNSHVPYVRPPEFPPRFGPEEVDFPVAFGRFPRDKAHVVRDLYSDSLAYVDAQLGKLLDALRADGRLDDTLVIVTGDTGQAFYEHGFASHGSYLFEEVVRVPLIVRAPGLEGGVDPRVAQHIDLPATMLDLLGLPPHPSHQGVSLASNAGSDATSDATSDARMDGRPVYLVCQTPLVTQYATVEDGWKLMLDVKEQRTQLFHLQQDPAETTDLSTAEPEVHRHLLDRLLEWVFAQVGYHESPERYLREYPPVLIPKPTVADAANAEPDPASDAEPDA